jgi:GT2 family glycosyltransferase
MTVNVSAVVLSHDEPASLSRVLDQLAKQTISPSRILVVDTSKKEAIDSQGFETLKLPHKTSFAASIDAAVKHLATAGYLWILHDDSAPDFDALEKLLKEVELSPSLAIVGPKQVDWDDSKLIKQLGLTLTRSGKLLSRVRGEFDQGQHDHLEDVMAVGTAGALVSLDKYSELQGFDPKAPALAADVDFSIRARLSGGRVAVAPAARISHRMLSMNGLRPTNWLGGAPGFALRQAEFHLALSYANFVVFLFGWLFLIPFAILNSLVLLIRKRARDIPFELSAALSVFLGVGKVLSSRARIRRTTSVSIRNLSSLRATRQEVKSSNQRAKDAEISKQLLAAHARGENDQVAVSANAGFFSSGAWWFALILIALNFAWFPTNVAVTGQGVIPLSSNWFDVFAAAGSTTQSLGLGFQAAGDPFGWVLAIVSAITFFEPSLSVTVLLYLSSAIAFAGFFRLTALVTYSTPIRITAALSFALWPALTVSVSDTKFSQVLAITLLPWLAHSLAQIAELGIKNPGSFVSTWSQVGVAAVLLALVAASSPALGAAVIVLILVLGLMRIKKLVPLIFSTGLTLVWFAPIALERINSGQSLTLLLDPGIQSPNADLANWTLPFLGFGFNELAFGLFVSVPILIFALLAILTPGSKAAAGLWVGALVSLALAFAANSLSFNFGELTKLPVNLNGLLALYGLFVILAFAQVSTASKALQAIAVSLVAIVGLAPAAFAMATNPPTVSYSDGRGVPSIIQADADAGVSVRTLKLEAFEDSVGVELFEGPGIKLDQLSTSFQVSESGLSVSNPEYQSIGQLVANLASANGADVISPLKEFGIGYVLVSPANRDLQMALDSTRGLESIGETDFGQLWKVQAVSGFENPHATDFGLGKIVGLAALAFYFLLALPTSSIRKRNGKESAIFVDVEESN